MTMHCFESEGLRIEAFEVKISKPDLKRELMNPDKHAVFFDEIDAYSIVAPFYVLDDLSIIPPKWGVYQVVAGEDGKPMLKTICRYTARMNAGWEYILTPKTASMNGSRKVSKKIKH